MSQNKCKKGYKIKNTDKKEITMKLYVKTINKPKSMPTIKELGILKKLNDRSIELDLSVFLNFLYTDLVLNIPTLNRH